ncbi:MAG TPA: hypothetical protein VLN91_04285, partial [Nitrospirota bacterium]|nr:hypothetical protein [Nitrospirota bacterium]
HSRWFGLRTITSLGGFTSSRITPILSFLQSRSFHSFDFGPDCCLDSGTDVRKSDVAQIHAGPAAVRATRVISP